MFAKRKKFYKKADLVPAIAQMQIDRDNAKEVIPYWEKKGGIWIKEAEGKREDVKSMNVALGVLRRA